MVPITVGLHVHRDTDGECRDRSPSQPARPTCGARGVLASRTASSSAVNRPTWPRVAVELAPAEQRIMCCWISPFNSKRSHFFNFPNVSPKLNYGTVKIVTLICLPRQKKNYPFTKNNLSCFTYILTDMCRPRMGTNKVQCQERNIP